MSVGQQEGADPWRVAVRPRYTELVERFSTIVDDLINRAYQERMITMQDKADLQVPMKSSFHRADELLTKMMHGGHYSFDKFLSILRNIGEELPMFNDIAQQLYTASQ